MAISLVKHRFASLQSDGSDPTQVQPSNWNDSHLMSVPTNLVGGNGLLIGTDTGTELSLDGLVATSGMQYLRRNYANSAFEFVPFQFFVAADYNFAAITPNVNLSGGGVSNTITLTPMPFGIAVGSYLYISNGTGGAEAVPVTGFSSTQVIVTCQNAHSGAWTIQSASGGLQEAINAAGTGNFVFLGNSIVVHANILVSHGTSIKSSPGAQLTTSGTFNSVFTISASNVAIEGFNVTLSNTVASFITNSGAINNLKILNNYTVGGNIPVLIGAGTDFLVQGNSISGFDATGVVFWTDVNLLRVKILGNFINSAGSTGLFGGGISVWGNYCVISNNVIRIGGNKDQGIVVLNNPGAGLNNAIISNNNIEIAGVSALEAIGVGSCIGFSICNNVIKTTVQVTAAGYYGIEVNQSSKGTVCNNYINLFNPTGEALGIAIFSSSYVTFQGNTIENWGTDGNSCAIRALNTDATNPASGQLSHNLISGNNCVQTNGAATNAAIRIDTIVPGVVNSIKISNNTLKLNSNVGSHGIVLTNFGGATCSNVLISDNFIDTCDTGIINTGFTASTVRVSNNSITNSNSKYLFDAATFLHDLMNGTLFANIPANLGNGSMLYVSNGTIANPVAGGGTGCILKRLNGVNVGN